MWLRTVQALQTDLKNIPREIVLILNHNGGIGLKLFCDNQRTNPDA